MGAHGLPVWRNQDGVYWLYSGRDGTWGLGDDEDKDQGFTIAGCFLYSKSHKNRPPHQVTGAWTYWDERREAYLDDKRITVRCNGEGAEDNDGASDMITLLWFLLGALVLAAAGCGIGWYLCRHVELQAGCVVGWVCFVFTVLLFGCFVGLLGCLILGRLFGRCCRI